MSDKSVQELLSDLDGQAVVFEAIVFASMPADGSMQTYFDQWQEAFQLAYANPTNQQLWDAVTVALERCHGI